MTTGLPPQGPLQPGQSFDAWCLAGMLLEAEAERDRIQEARWRHREGGDTEPSAYLCAAFVAWIEARATMQDRARRVALGHHSFEWACCLLCLDCPEHHETLIEELRDEVATHRHAIDRQIRGIEWRIAPLCKRRAPAEEVMATAETVGGPLPARRVFEVCQHAAAASVRRRAHV